jgi:hypothetical protein
MWFKIQFVKMNGTKSLWNPKNPSKDQTRDSITKDIFKKRGLKLDKNLKPYQKILLKSSLAFTSFGKSYIQNIFYNNKVMIKRKIDLQEVTEWLVGGPWKFGVKIILFSFIQHYNFSCIYSGVLVPMLE